VIATIPATCAPKPIPTASSTSALARRAVRVSRWVRGRLAPTVEDLEERASWTIKTRWVLSAWAAFSAFSAVGAALTPWLRHYPILLVASTPRLPFLILAAAKVHPLLFFCVAAARMLIADPINITLGRRYGARVVPRRAKSAMQRLGLFAVALRPTSKILAAAGACKLRTSRILAADVFGTIGLLVIIYLGTTSVVG
jgi:hypothetical protein